MAFGVASTGTQDFDGGEVGQFVWRALVASSGKPTAITWSVVSTDLFPNGPHDLDGAVTREKAWAIVASTFRHCEMIFFDNGELLHFSF